jgi:hypothetical protein
VTRGSSGFSEFGLYALGVIVSSKIGEHVMIVDWIFSDERGKMTVLHLRIDSMVMSDDKMIYEFLIVWSTYASA